MLLEEGDSWILHVVGFKIVKRLEYISFNGVCSSIQTSVISVPLTSVFSSSDFIPSRWLNNFSAARNSLFSTDNKTCRHVSSGYPPRARPNIRLFIRQGSYVRL